MENPHGGFSINSDFQGFFCVHQKCGARVSLHSATATRSRRLNFGLGTLPWPLSRSCSCSLSSNLTRTCLQWLFISAANGAQNFWYGHLKSATLMCLPSKAFSVCYLQPLCAKIQLLDMSELFAWTLMVAVLSLWGGCQSAWAAMCEHFMKLGLQCMIHSPNQCKVVHGSSTVASLWKFR